MESPHREDGQVVLLFYLLPNLRLLTLATSQDYDMVDDFLEGLSVFPTESFPAGFKSLREVQYRYNFGRITPKSLIALLKMPSIRTIRVRVLDDMSILSPAAYSDSSSVTKLDFLHGTVNTLALSRVLMMPRALTHFTFTDCLGDPGTFDCAVFARGLRASRPTLQYLRLSVADSYDGIAEKAPNAPQNTIGSLYDWPVLRSIWCPVGVLLGKSPSRRGRPVTLRLAEVLPAVLTDFRVAPVWGGWQMMEVVDKLVELVEEKNIYGPDQLTRITASMNKADEERLGVACNGTRVVMAVVPDPSHRCMCDE